jgi:hypothetical protein
VRLREELRIPERPAGRSSIPEKVHILTTKNGQVNLNRTETLVLA